MANHLITRLMRLLCLMVLCIQLLSAQDITDEKRQSLLEMLQLSKAKEKFETGQVEGFKTGFNLNPATATMPEEKKVRIFKIAQEVFTKEMPWNEFQEKLLFDMDKIYTQEQLIKLIALLKSDAGRILVDGELQMLGPSMALGAEMGKKMIPKLVERLKHIDEELVP